MSSSRTINVPLLERRAAEIKRLLAEVATLKQRIAELEAELEAAKGR